MEWSITHDSPTGHVDIFIAI